MNSNTPSTGQAIPDSIRELLGKPPLIRGESVEKYYALVAAIAEASDPQDAVDWLYVKDAADSTTESWRNRRCMAATLASEQPEALAFYLHLLKQVDGQGANADKEQMRILAYRYAAGDANAEKEVNDLLTKYEFDGDSAVALAYARQLNVLEPVARMLALAEHRRQLALHEIERRRLSRSLPPKPMAKAPQLQGPEPKGQAPRANTGEIVDA